MHPQGWVPRITRITRGRLIVRPLRRKEGAALNSYGWLLSAFARDRSLCRILKACIRSAGFFFVFFLFFCFFVFLFFSDSAHMRRKDYKNTCSIRGGFFKHGNLKISRKISTGRKVPWPNSILELLEYCPARYIPRGLGNKPLISLAWLCTALHRKEGFTQTKQLQCNFVELQ